MNDTNQWVVLLQFIWEWVKGNPLPIIIIILGVVVIRYGLKWGAKKAEGGTDEFSFTLAQLGWALAGFLFFLLLASMVASCGSRTIKTLGGMLEDAKTEAVELEGTVVAPELMLDFSEGETQVQQPAFPPAGGQQQVIIVTPTPDPNIGGGGGAAVAPPQTGRTHTVVAGDTLAKIATQYGSTVAAIAEANGIADPNRISVGQVLTIP